MISRLCGSLLHRAQNVFLYRSTPPDVFSCTETIGSALTMWLLMKNMEAKFSTVKFNYLPISMWRYQQKQRRSFFQLLN